MLFDHRDSMGQCDLLGATSILQARESFSGTQGTGPRPLFRQKAPGLLRPSNLPEIPAHQEKRPLVHPALGFSRAEFLGHLMDGFKLRAIAFLAIPAAFTLRPVNASRLGAFLGAANELNKAGPLLA